MKYILELTEEQYMHIAESVEIVMKNLYLLFAWLFLTLLVIQINLRDKFKEVTERLEHIEQMLDITNK